MRGWLNHIALWAALAAFSPVMAGEGTDVPVWAEDTAYVERRPGEEFLERFRDDPDFHYAPQGEETASLWERFWAWLRELLSSNGMRERTGDWEVYLWMGLAAAVFAVLIYLFVRHKGWRAFRRKPKDADFAPEGTDLAAEGEGQYARLLGDALGREDYVLAVRLRFAAVLRLLDERGIVRRGAGKTNRDYFYEIGDEARRRAFGRLCWVFDRVAYGEFPFGAEAYRQVEREFDDFEKEAGR